MQYEPRKIYLAKEFICILRPNRPNVPNDSWS